MRMYVRWILAASVALATGCNNETTTDAGTGGGAGGGGGFQQPAGTVAVNFTVDDTANKVFAANDGGASDLEWKGSFKIDKTTRKITADSTWGGPFPALYDDGPWSSGGHEPSGNTAADHKWGITVFVAPPATGSDIYEYGAQDGLFQGWLWRGSNGTFTVAAGATAPVTAAGLTLLVFGTNDLKLVIDTANLVARPNASDGGVQTWDLTSVKVKGSAWGPWVEAPMYDDATHGDATAADGKYTFVLSEVVGAGKLAPHSGLLSSGAAAEFVVVLGGAEYRSGDPSSQGVTAQLKVGSGSFADQAISTAGNKNPQVVVP